MIATIVSLNIVNKISSKQNTTTTIEKKSPTTTIWNNFACYLCLCHTLYTIGFHSAIYHSRNPPPAIPTILPNYLYFLHAAISLMTLTISPPFCLVKPTSGMSNFQAFQTLARKNISGKYKKLKV